MKTLTFLNNKGGVGKTTSATAIAHMLSEVHHKKVLICDMDPQGNTSNLFGNTDFVALFKARMECDILSYRISMGDLLTDTNMDVHSAIHHTAYKGLDIIPSMPTLSAVEERLKADIKMPQQFRLKNQLEKLQDEYDYCIIDCSPSLSILNVNALVATDEVYLPTLVDDGSLFGVELTKSELIEEIRKYAPALKIGGIFFTKYKGWTNVSKYSKELLETVYNNEVLPITISDNIIVSESTHNHMPLLAYDKGRNKSKATMDYLRLTEYIAAPNRKAFLKRLQNRQAERNGMS